MTIGSPPGSNQRGHVTGVFMTKEELPWFVLDDVGISSHRIQKEVVSNVITNAGDFAGDCHSTAFFSPELMERPRPNRHALTGLEADNFSGLDTVSLSIDLGFDRMIAREVVQSRRAKQNQNVSPSAIDDVLDLLPMKMERSALPLRINDEFFSVGFAIRPFG